MSKHITIETGPRGRIVMVEPEQRKGLDRRVFFYEANGTLLWAHYSDWQSYGERARWYGFGSKELPPSMCTSNPSEGA